LFLEGISRHVGISKVKFIDSQGREIPGVTIHSVSSGTAFDPASEDDLGVSHPAAEIVSGSSGPVLKAWAPGAFALSDSTGKSHRIEIASVNRPIEITGPWQVSFPAGWGAPDDTTFKQLASWTDHPDEGIKYFSGVAVYKNSFEIPRDYFAGNTTIELDLGIVQQVANVTLNGSNLRTLWKPPYSIDITREARPGKNELIIEVANTWNNRLVGDAGAPANKRFTRTNLEQRFSRANYNLQPSGLLGPVRLIWARETSLSETDRD
jgi:hypothetical protein